MAGSNTFGGTIKLQGESEYRKAISQISQQLKVMGSEMSKVTAEFGKNNTSTESLTQKNKILNEQIDKQKEKVGILNKALQDAKEQYGDNSKQAVNWQISLNKAEAQLISMQKEVENNNQILEKNEKQTQKNSNEIEKFGNSATKTGEKTLSLGDIIKGNLISEAIIGGVKKLASEMKELASKVGEVVTESINARGELEQQVGGVETLFKESSNTVIQNANNAYKTAGMSASDYMETVTSFSASLLDSLGGNTEKSAKVADMAIIDMSDNANKMGTSIESIQNAYQGFAKQNYTMLDNLKLGYGGTKTEMERLLKDAQKISGIKYNINNLNDVYSAIHVIQGELGITGTTAKESAETLEGSMSSMKSSWSNFLSGSGNLNQVVDSAKNVVNNVVRIANEAIPQIIGDLNSSLPQILELGKTILKEIITGIKTYLPNLMKSAIEIVSTLCQELITLLPELIEIGVQVITQLIFGIAQMLPELIPQCIDAIITIVNGLLDNIDMIIDAGIQLILGLADGLIEALPKLIEKAPEIIQKLFDAIINNLPKILQAGGELIGKLIMGIVGSFWKLLEVGPELVKNIVQGISGVWDTIKDAGKNIVEGLWQGISGMANWVYEKITGFANNIVANIKSALGIHSPSTILRDEVGKFMAQGIGVGFSNEMGNVAKDMQDAIPTKFDVSTSLIGNNKDSNSNSLTTALIQAFKEFKPSIILNGEQIGEFAFEYSNAKFGNYYN